ncbi:hypothetical protein L2E82_17294 [Cichorium intybus]|uniref:Uncharacterized protein n=1 Tax=Cichorium intybus TaxID=13427 RepID=A0ACB9F8I7_CICIN|nr:hypothetical protein L2E82_17294 [Cichorium intybus]
MPASSSKSVTSLTFQSSTDADLFGGRIGARVSQTPDSFVDDLLNHLKSQLPKPYDPINNYLSPRPKFLQYNPDQRRKILVLQENEESVEEGEDNVNKEGEREEEGESDDEE